MINRLFHGDMIIQRGKLEFNIVECVFANGTKFREGALYPQIGTNNGIQIQYSGGSFLSPDCCTITCDSIEDGTIQDEEGKYIFVPYFVEHYSMRKNIVTELHHSNIFTIDQILDMTIAQLGMIPGVGKKSVTEIIEAIPWHVIRKHYTRLGNSIDG